MSEGAIARLTGLLAADAANEKKLASDATEKVASHAAEEQKSASDAVDKARVEFEGMREFLAVRDAVIAPTATAFARHLVASGHRARTEASDCTPQTLFAAAVPGQLSFAFGLDAGSETSVLTFIGYPGAVQVHYHYEYGSRGRRTGTFASSREFPLAELTQKRVEDIFLTFISKVLNQTDL